MNGSYKKKGRREPVQINAVLNSALKKYGIDEHLARYQFVQQWDQIVGEEIAKRTAPEAIKNGKLIVRVNSSVWAQELSFQKEVILKRLKRYIDDESVLTDVHFYVVGSFP